MRIGIAGLLHESNTFAGTQTTRQQFEEAFLHQGADLIPVWNEAHHEIGGFIEGCAGVEAVPLLAGWATPGGPLTDETYDSLTAELIAQLKAAGPLDGLLLALHGAMVTESHANADGETLARAREAVGPDLPIVVTLDMHGNVSQRMADLADAIVAYRTYPHVDQRQRGLEAAALLQRMVRDEVEAHMAFRKLPLLIHIVQQFTSDGPMAEIFREVDRLNAGPHVLSVSVLPGYIYADVPDMGVSVLVVAYNRETAERPIRNRWPAFGPAYARNAGRTAIASFEPSTPKAAASFGKNPAA